MSEQIDSVEWLKAMATGLANSAGLIITMREARAMAERFRLAAEELDQARRAAPESTQDKGNV